MAPRHNLIERGADMHVITNPTLPIRRIASCAVPSDGECIIPVVRYQRRYGARMHHGSRAEAARSKEKIIGPALTVRLTPGDIVDCLGVFDLAQPGDVVVIDAFSERSTSIWGGLMSGLARNAGIAGAVIDGSCRDTDEATLLGFPITSRYVSPRAAHTATSGRKEPIAFNVPIVCGGIIVNPGDLVVADEIGVSVVPRELLAQVYPKAQQQADLENSSARSDFKRCNSRDPACALWSNLRENTLWSNKLWNS